MATLYATSSGADAVHGYLSSSIYAGVAGDNETTSGCSGTPGSTSCNGVWAGSHDGIGIYAQTANSSSYAGYFDGNVKVTGTLTCGSGCSSDARLKRNIEPVHDAIDQLLRLKGVTFEWIDPSAHEHEAGHGVGKQTGFIAQDVEKVFPSWVDKDGYPARDGQTYRTLELRQIEALEVESIRTLKMENDLLKDRVHDLEAGLHPHVSGIDLNSVGFGVGGLAIGVGMFFMSRRKREDARAIS